MTTSYYVRSAQPGDLTFVYDATKQSLRHSKEYAKKSNFVAYGEINPAVNALLPACDVLVADLDGEIVGFIAYFVTPSAFVVGFTYTKHDYRRRGIAREMLTAALEAAPADREARYVFRTSRFAELAERYGFTAPEGSP